MKLDKMSAKDKKVGVYHHLESSAVAWMPSSRDLTDMVGGRPIRTTAPHKFYEGTVENNGKDAIFFLQKLVSSDRELGELGIVMAEVSIGNISHKLAQDKEAMGNERFERHLEAETLFRKYGIPSSLIGKIGLSHAHALYQRFAEDAVIVVPGYVAGVSVNEYDKIVSQIDIIPKEERPEIERKLRARNLKGPLNFWN